MRLTPLMLALGAAIATPGGANAAGHAETPVISTIEASRACDALDDAQAQKDVEIRALRQVHDRVLAQMQADNDRLEVVRRHLDHTSQAEIDAYNGGLDVLRARNQRISAFGKRLRQLTEDYNRENEKRNKRCAAMVLEGDDADLARADREALDQRIKERTPARLAALVAEAEREMAELLVPAVFPAPVPVGTPRRSSAGSRDST